MSMLPDQPVLFGREPERQMLFDAFSRAVEGQGVLVLINGEAGIGKTSLVDDLALRVLAQDVLVLAGAAYEVTVSPPYGPWVEIIRALPDDQSLPALPDQLRPGGGMAGIDSQAALFELASRYLASVAAVRPLVMVLEDLHWFDPASLDLLRHLSRTLAGEPALIVATYRDDEITPGHHLFELLPPMLREGRVERLPLQRLERKAVLQLIRERFRLPGLDEDHLISYLERLAEGNPFFVNELLYTLVERQILRPHPGGWDLGDLSEAIVPSLIQQVINGRLARIESESRELLDIAAIIGYDVELDLLRELHDGSDAALDAALQQAFDHHLVRMRGQQRSVRFSHPLVRQTIYEAIAPLRRQALHRRVGDSQAGRSRPDLSTVAHHFYEAGDERALEWLLRAAEQAQSLFAPQTVIGHASRGIDLANRLGIQEPLDLYRLRGLARESLGDFDGARSDHELVLARAGDRGDQRAEWQALLDLGSLWAFQDYERTRHYSEQSVELARYMDDPTPLGHSLNGLGNWYTNANLPEDALRHHEEALAIFERIDDQSGVASTLDLLGVTHYIAGDMAKSLHYYERAIPLLRRLDDRVRLSSALATVFGSAGQDIASLTVANQALPPSLGSDPRALSLEATEIARSIGLRSAETYAIGFLGALSNVRGNLRDGLRELDESLAIAESIEHHQWTALANQRLGTVYLELLSYERAGEYCERALDIAIAVNSTFFREGSIALLAMAHTRAGLLDSAEELLKSVVDLEALPSTLTMRSCWLAYAELLLAQGHHDSSLEVINRLIDSVPPDGICLSPYLTKMRGQILMACDRLEDAEVELQAAHDAAMMIGNRLIIWQIAALQARLHLAQGRIELADRARSSAFDIVSEHAAELDDEELRRTFLRNARALIPSAVPYRPDRPVISNPPGLTARELEVLQAVADGLTDAEVGERLYIATRTVSQHLRSVYNKLGVGNRAAAVRAAMEQGLI